jgi:hypothetical protein
MKKVKACLIKACSVFLAVILVLSFCGCSREYLPSEKYASYVCYDYQLACLSVDTKKSKETTVTYTYEYVENNVTDGSVLVIYQKIPDVSDDQFISGHVRTAPILDVGSYAVLQNPDNYVDVMQDWTIRKIELYYVRVKQQNQSAIVPDKVIASTSDAECLSACKEFVLNGEDTETNLDGYVSEYDTSRWQFYMRVYFNESKNIVWEAQIRSYFSDELQDRLIYVDKGRHPYAFSTRNDNFVSLVDYPQLYSWISDAVADAWQDVS